MPFVLAFGPEAAQEVFANRRPCLLTARRGVLSRPFLQPWTDVPGLRGTPLPSSDHAGGIHARAPAWLSGIQWTSIGRAAAAALSGDELLVYPYLKRTLLDIATVVFMGDEPGPQSQTDGEGLHRLSARRNGCGSVSGSWTRAGRQVCEAGSPRAVFPRRVDAKRASDGDDLFAALCRIRDEDGNQFTDDDVVNHMIFLMMAATDTCATAATAVLHQLALHPEWQERVRAESFDEIGDGRLDLDALDRMQSLGMVINESMRLLAPVPGAMRKTLADTSIQGYFVPEDTMVVVALWLNHYWPACGRSRTNSIPSGSAKHGVRTDRTVLPSCRSVRVHTSASVSISRRCW